MSVLKLQSWRREERTRQKRHIQKLAESVLHLVIDVDLCIGQLHPNPTRGNVKMTTSTHITVDLVRRRDLGGT